MIYIEMTGSPKVAWFATKEIFLERIREKGFEHAKMTMRNNVVSILVTNDLNSQSNKMQMAKRLGIDIITYEDLAVAYGINVD
jgi:hypothetical protein